MCRWGSRQDYAKNMFFTTTLHATPDDRPDDFIGAIGLAAAPQRVVKVAVFPNVPAIFMDRQGQPYGFYVDMLREVAAKEGWDLRFVPGTWQESLDRAQSGDVDLLTCVAYTPERDLYLDYGQEPSFTVWSILYTHPGSGITTVLDARNRRIALMRGDINGEHFRELCTRFNLPVTFLEYGGFSDVLQAVADGQADGGVTSNIFGYSQESMYGVERTPVVFSPFDHHFATKEGRNGDLLAALDTYLRDGRNRPGSGYHRAINRWLSPQAKAGLPPWAWRTGLAILAALALSIAVAFVFRRRVGKATAEIRELNRGLERELAERKRVAEQILHMVNGLSAATGESFLHELVKHLAQATEADVAFIGERLSAGDAGRIRTLSVFSRGVPGENFDYDQAGTPCEQAIRGEVCVFADHVQEQLPHLRHAPRPECGQLYRRAPHQFPGPGPRGAGGAPPCLPGLPFGGGLAAEDLLHPGRRGTGTARCGGGPAPARTADAARAEAGEPGRARGRHRP